MTSGTAQSGCDLQRGPGKAGGVRREFMALGLGSPGWTRLPRPPYPAPRLPESPLPGTGSCLSPGPLTKRQNPIQGHVLSYVKQGRHRQLVCQIQSRSKTEAVTWGTGGPLVSGTHWGRAREEKGHWGGGSRLRGRPWPEAPFLNLGSKRWGGVSPT